MAAAEYFASAGPPPHASPNASSPYLNPPQPQRTSSGPAWANTNQSQQSLNPPPSYHSGPGPPEQRPGVHFAPLPSSPPQRHSFSGQQHRPSFSTTPPQNTYMQQRPHQSSWSGPSPQSYPPQQVQAPTSNPAPPPPIQHGASPYGTPPRQSSGFLSAATPPHMKQYTTPSPPFAQSQYSLDGQGYSSDPEHHRRRRKHRERHHSDAQSTSREVHNIKSHSRSTNSDAFLGAAGGGLIGDLIFPGLGTLGGAALGWLGGKDYGNHRKWREDKRERSQRDWEGKYGPAPHPPHRHHSHDGRSHSYSHDSKHGSGHDRQYDDKERRHSHDKRDQYW